MRQLLSLTVLALAASMAQAQIRVGDIQPCQGSLGPLREPVYDLYDDVFVRGTIYGAQTDAQHYVSVDMVVDVVGPDGKVYKHTSIAKNDPQVLGNQSPFAFHFAIDRAWKPGEYTLKANLKDNESGKETSCLQKFTILPKRLAILPPQFFFDEERKSPGPNGGFVGQIIYFNVSVVGLENTKGVDFEMSAQVRDSAAQKVLWKIGKKEIKETDPEKVKSGGGNIGGAIPLGTPGDYILRTYATDYIAGKTVVCDFPLHIEAPGKGMLYESVIKEMDPLISDPPSLIQVSSPPK